MNAHNNEGFMVLLPKGEGSVLSTPSFYPTSANTIGDHRLIRRKRASVTMSTDGDRFSFNGSSSQCEYTVEYKTKAWQNKAWFCIGRDINFSRTPAFKYNRSVSKKMKHLLRLGVAIKIRAAKPIDPTKPNTAKPVIRQMAPANNLYGIYSVGDTRDQIIDTLNSIYDMLYNHVDEIISIIDDWGYEEAIVIMKAFLVYDDKSYDWVTGNPHKLFKLLGLKFTKEGKVKL